MEKEEYEEIYNIGYKEGYEQGIEDLKNKILSEDFIYILTQNIMEKIRWENEPSNSLLQ